MQDVGCKFRVWVSPFNLRVETFWNRGQGLEKLRRQNLSADG